MNKIKIGFTLVETLVTLVIIGIVSAMTIPSLSYKYRKIAYVNKLRKTNSELSQAFALYMYNNGAQNLPDAGLNSNKAMIDFFKAHFKVVAIGNATKYTPWHISKYKNLNGQTINYTHIWEYGACLTLENGVQICMDNPASYTYSYGGHSARYGNTFIDINGPKGPNIIGRDAFWMVTWDDGSLDVQAVPPFCKHSGVCRGASTTALRGNVTACRNSGVLQYTCFGQILNDNWEMKY